MKASDPAASPTAGIEAEGSAGRKASSFSRKSAGSWATLSPSRSLIWLEKMISATPAVKPIVTE